MQFKPTPGARVASSLLIVSFFILSPAIVPIAGAQEAAKWAPPKPDDSTKDWVQLHSGEWVGGTIERFDDDTLYVDSDDLDDLSLDWGDVTAFRSARKNTFRFVGREVVTGTAVLQDGLIRIETDAGVVERDRGDLVGMIEGVPKELNYWSTRASFGLAARAGNNDQADITGLVEVQRRSALTRSFLGYNGSYGTANNDTLTNSHRLAGTFDMYVTRRFFVTVPSLEGYWDKIVNIDFRGTAGAGVGYEILEMSKLKWQVSAGAAYQYTSFLSVTGTPFDPNAGKWSNDGAATAGTTIELDPTGDLEWDTTYSTQIIFTDIDKTSQHLLSMLSFDIWGPLDLDVSFNWDWINKPQRAADGTRPDSSDFRISVGLGFDL